jgi:uncharacterized protein YukE
MSETCRCTARPAKHEHPGIHKRRIELPDSKAYGVPRTPDLKPKYLPLKIMAQAIMDPEEVRRFAKELKRFNDDVQVRASALQSRFAALGSTWQDQEAEKFAEEFIATMKVLRKFVEVSEQHTPYLLRKAQRIEEYLDQR